jgi:hypothetical protein
MKSGDAVFLHALPTSRVTRPDPRHDEITAYEAEEIAARKWLRKLAETPEWLQGDIAIWASPGAVGSRRDARQVRAQ